jgi:hypothetical protein
VNDDLRDFKLEPGRGEHNQPTAIPLDGGLLLSVSLFSTSALDEILVTRSGRSVDYTNRLSATVLDSNCNLLNRGRRALDAQRGGREPSTHGNPGQEQYEKQGYRSVTQGFLTWG